MLGHDVDRRDPWILKHTWSLQHQRQDSHTRQMHSAGYTDIQLIYRTSKVDGAIRMYWFSRVLSPLTKLPSGSCAIYSNADVYVFIFWFIIIGFDVVCAGTCFWFGCHWRGVPCGVDDLFAQSLSCMCSFWYVGSWCTVGRVQAHSLSIFGANASVFYRCMTAGPMG